MARRVISDGLTPEALRAALDYDPATGLFTWRDRPGNNANARTRGRTAGHRCNRLGYVLLNFNQRLYRAHRLVWLHVHGVWPTGDIDHINGDGLDNRLANLRDASRWQNTCNRRTPSSNSSGLKGAYWLPDEGKWLAQIRAAGRQYYLGKWDTAEEAHIAWCGAASVLHGEFQRPG